MHYLTNRTIVSIIYLFLGVIWLTTPATFYKGMFKHTRCTKILYTIVHLTVYFHTSLLIFRNIWTRPCDIGTFISYKLQTWRMLKILSVWQCQIKFQEEAANNIKMHLFSWRLNLSSFSHQYPRLNNYSDKWEGEGGWNLLGDVINGCWHWPVLRLWKQSHGNMLLGAYFMFSWSYRKVQNHMKFVFMLWSLSVTN